MRSPLDISSAGINLLSEDMFEQLRLAHMDFYTVVHGMRRGVPVNLAAAERAVDRVGEELMKELARRGAASLAQADPYAGTCGRPEGCVCGGDLPRVRAGCGWWEKS